jgi:anti-repressor protein
MQSNTPPLGGFFIPEIKNKERKMNELIPINYEGGSGGGDPRPTVSGRELHAALEIKERYTEWFKRMCEYGFADNKDFFELSEISESSKSNNSLRKDHSLTIPMAKELCMLQRSEKGKKFREYFIACEEAWNSPEKVMERAMQIAHARAVEAERRVFSLFKEKERLAFEKRNLQIELDESREYFTIKRVAARR